MPTSRFVPHTEAPGLAARRIAADIIDNTLRRHRQLDDQLEGPNAHPGLKSLDDRDRALMRRLVATVLRRRGTLRYIFAKFLERGLPHDAPRVESALMIGAVQILWMDVPDHAAVDLAVRLVQADRRASHYAGLVNAVLRRCAREGHALAQEATALSPDLPEWLMARWQKQYGEDAARAMATAIAVEPPLDITVKSNADHWATRLHGIVLPTQSVRTALHGPVAMLPGYHDGEWWVQDAAAALPARLFGDIAGKRIVDLCAAPGGKTAQLILAGAQVTAVDRAPSRMARLKANLARLKLKAECVVADAGEWTCPPCDGVLVDAPCSATGTLRRHPDIAWLKSEDDIASLLDIQLKLARHASTLLKSGGTLIYCTCSLEQEEGENIIAQLLEQDTSLTRRPITADEIGGLSQAINAQGDLRTLRATRGDGRVLRGATDQKLTTLPLCINPA